MQSLHLVTTTYIKREKEIPYNDTFTVDILLNLLQGAYFYVNTLVWYLVFHLNICLAMAMLLVSKGFYLQELDINYVK